MTTAMGKWGLVSALAVLLAVEEARAGDSSVFADTSSSTKASTITGSDTGIITGGNISLLLAFAYDSIGGSKNAFVPPPATPYLGLLIGPISAGPVKSSGPSFTADSRATIGIPGPDPLPFWSDAASFARIAPHIPPAPPRETASAVFIVKDPMIIGDIADAATATFATTIGTGASLALGEGGLSAAYSGFDNTTLNDLGELWSWTWSATSATPGVSTFSFVSNPALGLDDAALVSAFESLVTYNPTTGTYGLLGDFTVTTTVNVLPDQTSYDFGGGTAGDLDAAIGTIPEPSTWAMLLLGFASLGFAGCRRTKVA
jgi:PEP-CTERM motif